MKKKQNGKKNYEQLEDLTINLKRIFYYDTEPTEITKRIEKITKQLWIKK